MIRLDARVSAVVLASTGWAIWRLRRCSGVALTRVFCESTQCLAHVARTSIALVALGGSRESESPVFSIPMRWYHVDSLRFHPT